MNSNKSILSNNQNSAKHVVVIDKNTDFAANVVSGRRGTLKKRRSKLLLEPDFNTPTTVKKLTPNSNFPGPQEDSQHVQGENNL